MGKIFQKLSLILILVIGMSSCGNSNFDKAVSLLGSCPVFIANERVDQVVEYEGNTVNITIPNLGELYTSDGEPVTDDLVITAFLKDLFNNNLTIYTVGRVLDTKEGESPIEDFLSQAEKKNVNFVVEYNDTKITLTPDQLKEKLTNQ